MPQYMRPGVYLTETLQATQSTSFPVPSYATLVSSAARGPEKPTLVGSWTQFQNQYGGFSGADQGLAHAVYQYFNCGGGQVYVQRVLPTGAETAFAQLNNSVGSAACFVSAVNAGTWGNLVSVTVVAGSLTLGTFGLIVNYQGSVVERWLDISLDPTSFRYAPSMISGSNYISVTSAVTDWTTAATPVVSLTPVSLAGGDDGSMPDPNASPGAAATVVLNGQGASSSSPILRASAKSVGLDGNALSITIGASNTSTGTFDVSVSQSGSVVDSWSGVTLDPTGSNKVVNISSTLVAFDAVFVDAYDPATHTPANGNSSLTGGFDPPAPSVDDPWTVALNKVAEVPFPLIVNLPGLTNVSVLNSAITRCEDRGDMMLVVDTPQNLGATDAVAFADVLTPSSYAVVYYPWLQVADPAVNSPLAARPSAPGASVLGVISRNDTLRGAYRAPAGVTARLSGVLRLERLLSNSELDLLNENNVNSIRSLVNYGPCVFGARTLKKGQLDRYISVRRTLILIKTGLVDATRYAVFENNDDRLRNDVTTICYRLLNQVWQAGGLRGASAAEAFFVKCDGDNNSSNQIAAGELHIDVGVALQAPAEFIIISIGQYETGATSTEVV